GGVMAQCLPHADLDGFARLRAAWSRSHIQACTAEGGPGDWLLRLVPEAIVQGTQPLALHCRCSRERAQGALRMLPRGDLDEMALGDAPTVITCEFCDSRYAFAPHDLHKLAAGKT
ncbi:MAG: hypothetical protein EOO40_06195, partial [Deltaproteobacteria bacterium]